MLAQVCVGVLLMHIVCGFACIVFMQMLMTRISLNMIFTVPYLQVVHGVNIVCCINKIATKTFLSIFQIIWITHSQLCESESNSA